jgi:hypothetical protein
MARVLGQTFRLAYKHLSLLEPLNLLTAVQCIVNTFCILHFAVVDLKLLHLPADSLALHTRR